MSTFTQEKHSYYFFIEEDKRSLRHEEEELADHLCDYLVDEYKNLLFYDKSALTRMEAADKIAYYSKNDLDLGYLKSAARLDTNPNVRNAARKSIRHLEDKILNYRN